MNPAELSVVPLTMRVARGNPQRLHQAGSSVPITRPAGTTSGRSVAGMSRPSIHAGQARLTGS
jgi:hypothetical protein